MTLTTKPKVAIITSHPIQYNAPMFRLLTERGHLDARVFYSWGTSVLENKFDPGFGKVIEWDIPLLEGYEYEFLRNISGDPGTSHFNGIINPDLVERVDAFNPDAILVYGWSFKSHFQALRHYHGKKPVIFRGDSTMLARRPFMKRLSRNLFLKWLYGHVDYALYVGTNNYEYYKTLGMQDNQLFYAPHAIDNERFSKTESQVPETATSYRKNLGIPEDKIVFLYAGKLESNKAVDTLMKAFVLSGLAGTAELVIVGNGKMEAAYKEEFESKPGIHFMGFQNQSVMPALYRMADVYILPSEGPEETWGLAVNEAMASARPAIVSDRCGCARDVIVHGITGYVFRAGDLEGLTETLISAASKGKGGLSVMGQAAQKKISQFSFINVVIALEQLMDKIALPIGEKSLTS